MGGGGLARVACCVFGLVLSGGAQTIRQVPLAYQPDSPWWVTNPTGTNLTVEDALQTMNTNFAALAAGGGGGSGGAQVWTNTIYGGMADMFWPEAYPFPVGDLNSPIAFTAIPGNLSVLILQNTNGTLALISGPASDPIIYEHGGSDLFRVNAAGKISRMGRTWRGRMPMGWGR